MAWRIPVRICRDADATHAGSRRAYAHTFCCDPPTICVSSAFFDLSPGHRDGILAHEIGHILAGHDGDEEAADRAFEEATGVRIQYRDGEFGRCLQWLPEDDRRDLLGVFEFEFSGVRSDVKTPERDDVRFFVKSDGVKAELGSLEEAEALAAHDPGADVWAQEGRRRLGWRPISRNPRVKDAWKTPPPCDVKATGRPLSASLSKKLEGKPVRVHLNLHNGCYVFTLRGRVIAYATHFYLRDVRPKVGVGGFRRCHENKVRNVHAYLEGTFVDGKPPPTRGRGWRQITYNCKTNQRPCFFYVDNDECFEGAEEVRAWRVDNGDGTERCEVWVRGDSPKKTRANPLDCKCDLPGGACVCGAVDDECAIVVECGP